MTNTALTIPGAELRPVERERRAVLGQFLTPTPVADLMAALFTPCWRDVELLDAGAGGGALTAAFVRRFCDIPRKPASISVTAYEIDSNLTDRLQATLAECRRRCNEAGIFFSATVFNEDFISSAVTMIQGDMFARKAPDFNVAIVNPPYRKIQSDSSARLLLRSAGIETTNLYTGFVALIAKLLRERGELVAITPRSFCNGPYFKPFRLNFLDVMSLRHLHVFESRSAAFNGDDVLQENVVLHAVKGGPKPQHVVISSSSGEPDGAVTRRNVDYRDIISSDDPEQFIHLLTDVGQTKIKSLMGRLPSTLADLGLTISTGRVVDFRAQQQLRQSPRKNTAPLIYPCHFSGGFVHWPKSNSRKPNAIVIDERTRGLLVPSGVYVLTKRFTAKEEPRRVVACIYDPERLPAATLVGFENHLNYFHMEGRGLHLKLAKGLAAFLNSTVLDEYFRQFSGHTQVNATDLRALNYPTKSVLERLGSQVDGPGMEQSALDRLVEEELDRNLIQ